MSQLFNLITTQYVRYSRCGKRGRKRGNSPPRQCFRHNAVSLLTLLVVLGRCHCPACFCCLNIGTCLDLFPFYFLAGKTCWPTLLVALAITVGRGKSSWSSCGTTGGQLAAARADLNSDIHPRFLLFSLFIFTFCCRHLTASYALYWNFCIIAFLVLSKNSSFRYTLHTHTMCVTNLVDFC